MVSFSGISTRRFVSEYIEWEMLSLTNQERQTGKAARRRVTVTRCIVYNTTGLVWYGVYYHTILYPSVCFFTSQQTSFEGASDT